MASSGIVTQDILSILHNLLASSGLITQQALEVLYNEPVLNTSAWITQNLVQVAYTVSSVEPSGIVTQDVLSVLHNLTQNASSGLVTQQALEVLYTAAEPSGPPSGIVTQDVLSVLHSVNQGSGLVTQQAIEVLYLPTEFLNTRALITQNLVQVAVGTGVIALLQSGVFTQNSVSILQDFDTSGRFTQNFVEVLYSSITGAQPRVTQDSLGVLHNVASPSGRFTQDFIEVLYNEAGHFSRFTQNSIGILQDFETSGRFSQNFIEILYSTNDNINFTQQSLGILQNVALPSGRFTQDFIEILYSELIQSSKFTQSSLGILQNFETSGRFTQNFVEILYNQPPALNVKFNVPIEKLQEVRSTNSEIFLVEAFLNSTDYTEAARNNTPNDVPLLETTPQFNDYFSFKGGNRFDEININLTTLGDWDGSIDWQYFRDDFSYVSIPFVVDRTNGFRQNGLIYWPNLMDMGKHDDGSYEVRARVSIFTSLTTQPLASRIDLTTNIGAQGRMPIEGEHTKQTKIISVDCKQCNPVDCACGPCCCQCNPISGFNIHFNAWETDDNPCPGPHAPGTFTSAFTNLPFFATGLVQLGREDCYHRLGLEGSDEFGGLSPTSFIWSGQLNVSTPTETVDCWRISWGCGIDSGLFISTEEDDCSGYQLIIEVLKCSGSKNDPCDNGDNLGNVDFAGIGGISATVPQEVGGLSGCSCLPHLFVYTGICFDQYECHICDSTAGFCFNLEVLPV